MDPKNYFRRLSKALEFAVSEWLLIFLLFIDACFTYLIAKFASYSRLQGPCVLCSRYDHVLAKDKKGIYWDSICNHHKSEIASVVLLHVHDKLLETHEICENCLSSFATKTKNEFNDENFRLLVGKMKSNPLFEDKNRDSSGSRICFCCNDASESLFTNGEHSKNEKNIFVDDSLESSRSLNIGDNQIARSSEFEYQKVDVNSDNESEIPVYDNGSAHALVAEAHDLDNDPATVTSRDSEELKWRDYTNKEDVSLITEITSFNEVPLCDNAETCADDFLDTTKSQTTNEPIITETDPFTTTNNNHQLSNYLDLGDAYKLAISTKGRQLSGKFLDQKSFKDSSTRVNQDLKILLSNRSNDNTIISPKLSFNSDELTSMHFLQSRISLERNESNLSLDGSIVSEIEGENAIDRLKRQIEHDKKIIGVLYKELEEERNASAVATNQAMAMITRLQEEKSALYTEALQSLRMMEEQSEYDNEALQKANELVEEKDERIRDLEERLRSMTFSEDSRE